MARAYRLYPSGARHDVRPSFHIEEGRARHGTGGEDAGIERSRHQHGDAASLAFRHEAIHRAMVEQRIAPRQHEAVEVAIRREAQQYLPVVDADADGLDRTRTAKLVECAIGARHRLAISVLDLVALPAPVDVVNQ